MITDREKAAFEAGIKLGALYHQWVGAPVSPDTAPLLEQAMERSVALQPHVRHVRIHLNRERILPNPFGYSEVKGEQFEVQLTTRVGDATCHAVLSYEGGYPLMKIASFEGGTA
jgi:hypothetical protein